MSVKNLINDFIDRCTILATSNDANIEPVDHDNLWNVLFSATEKDDGNFNLLKTVLPLYRTKIPNFNEENQIIRDNTMDYLNAEKSFKDRTVHAKAILQLIPLFQLQLAKSVIQATIDIVHSQINANNDVPVDFLDPLADCDIDLISEDDTEQFIEFIKSTLQGEKLNAAICVFSCICHGLAHLDPTIGKLTKDILLSTLKKDDNESKIVGCYMVMFASELFSHDPETAPSQTDLSDLLSPLLVVENDILRKRANRAYRRLIETEIFLNETQLDKYLQSFDSFPERYYVEYFKIILYFITPHDDEDIEEDEAEEDEENLEIIQPIVDFVTEKLKSTLPIVRGLCLDAMSDLGYKDRMYIEENVKDALKVSSELIEQNHFPTYLYVANFLSTLAHSFPEESDSISKLVPIIVKNLENEQVGILKHRIDCCSTIAVIIKKGICVDQSENISKFVLNRLQESDLSEALIVKLCDAIPPLAKTISFASEIFQLLSKAFKACEDPENAKLISFCIKKLLKHQNISEADALDLVNASLNGELKFLNNTAPYMIFPPSIPPFFILDSYIKKFPVKAGEIVSKLVTWFGDSQLPVAPAVLIPIISSFDVGCFNKDLSASFATMIKEKINKCEPGDGHEIGAFCEAARKLYQIYPESLTPIIDYLKPLVKIVSHALPGLEEEDEEDMIDDFTGEGMPEVASFVFNVYASDDQVEVLDELLAPLVMMLPFEPGCEELPDIFSNLIEMFEDKERFSDILVPGLRIIVEFLLLKRSEIEKYNLEDDLINDLKNMLKKCCKGDKALTTKLTSTFKGQRAKLNRFNALIR